MTSQKLVDATIRRQTYIERFSGGLAKRINDQVDTAGIISILADPDLSNAKKKAALKKFLSTNKNKIDKALGKELKGMYKADYDWMMSILGDGISKPDKSMTKIINEALDKPLIANGGYTPRQAYDNSWSGYASNQRNIINAVSIGGLTKADGLSASRAANRALKRNLESAVRTSTFAVNDGIRNEVYKANDDIIRGVMFTAVLDGRTTDYCKLQDGKIVPLSSDKRPPFHINCRTIAVPVLTNETDKEARETLEFRRQVTAGDEYERGDNTLKPVKKVREDDILKVDQAPIKGAKSSGTYAKFLASQADTSYGKDFIRDTMGVKKGNRFIRQVDQGKSPDKAMSGALNMKAKDLDLDGLKKRANQ